MRSAKEVKGSERKDKGNHEPNPRKNPVGEGDLIHTDTGHVSNGTIKNGKNGSKILQRRHLLFSAKIKTIFRTTKIFGPFFRNNKIFHYVIQTLG